MKILIGEFGHETNTFSIKRSSFEILAQQGWALDDKVISTFEGSPSYIGGMLKAAREHDVEIIPTISIENAGPTISTECLNEVMDMLLTRIQAHKGEIDGICLALHGAGCAEGVDDLETYTLQEVRKIVGDDMPITVTLDLHGNISQEMAQLSNGLFGIKENPHTDYAETGHDAMSALVRIIKDGIRPVTDVVALGALFTLFPTIEGRLFSASRLLRNQQVN